MDFDESSSTSLTREFIAVVREEVFYARGVRRPKCFCNDHRGVEDWPSGPLVDVGLVRGCRWEKRTGGATVSTGSVKVADHIIMHL